MKLLQTNYMYPQVLLSRIARQCRPETLNPTSIIWCRNGILFKLQP